MSKKLNDQEYRNLRIHTLNTVENMLKRPLQAYEREILLFPRMCVEPKCREWVQFLLMECKNCRQVSYCKANPEHLSSSHDKWCKSYLLYQKLVLRQKILGRIDPILPAKILMESISLPQNIDETFKIMYKNTTGNFGKLIQKFKTFFICKPHISALQDECVYASLTQVASGPLTAINAYQKCGLIPNSTFTVHLIGAELAFEGDTLDKFESFFLHMIPQLSVMNVVFIGSELNVENVPIDVISRIR